MPVQPIGGSKVYVITGSNRDPRLTSTGQSWANLVTQQKYRLWNEAQKQAMQDIQFEQMTFQQKQALYDARRKQLIGAIDDAKERARKLELEEIKSAQAVKEEAISQQNIRSRPKTVSSGDSGLPTDPIDKRINSAQIRFNSLIGTSEDLNKRIIELRGPRGRNAAENEAEIERVQEVLDQVDAQKNTLNKQLTEMQATREKVAKGLIKPPRAGRTTIGGGAIQTATPIDYTAQIAELEAEQAALEKQLAGLEVPTLARPDLLGRTREVYAQRFAPQPRQPMIAPARQAEFAALEMEPPQMPAPVVEQPPQPIVEQPEEPVFQPSKIEAIPPQKENFVDVMYSSKVRDANMSNKGAAQLAMETIRDLPQFFAPQTKDHDEIRAQIIKAYQMHVNPQAVQAIEKGQAGQKLKADNKQVQLVQGLYSPASNATPEKKQELFENAVKELKRYHGDNKQAYNDSIAILVQLHEESK